MYCQQCGKKNVETAAFCISCGADLHRVPSEKETAVIRINTIDDTIAAKNEEIQESGNMGPGLLFILGFLVLIYGLFYPLFQYEGIVIGIIIMVVAFLWSNRRVRQIKKLYNEIRSLEAELKGPNVQ